MLEVKEFVGNKAKQIGDIKGKSKKVVIGTGKVKDTTKADYYAKKNLMDKIREGK